ncbi:MAG: helix-turn-helix transcriptional regulator [Actinocatenispora sp.]
MAPGSTVPRRQLGRELRKLRTAADLKIEQVTSGFGWSRSKLFRIEKGEVPTSRTDVMAMCQLYGAADALADTLIALADESKRRGWWHSHSDAIPEWFTLYVSLEATASRLRHYCSELVPDLLQTPEYAREVALAADTGTDVDAATRVRTERQTLLTREDPPHLEVVVNEAVIRRPVGGPTVMADQLQHLLDAVEVRSATIRVLPFAAGVHAGMSCPYALLGFPGDDEDDVAYVQTPTSGAYVEKPAELARYQTLFADATDRSLDQDRSRDLIAAAVKEFRS